MLKKEQSALSVRLEQVEDPAYLESLQRDVAKHQLRLSKLSTLQKRTQKTKKTCENTIEKELLRNELSMNTRHLQELHMENEGVRMQIREAELDEDRNYALSVEMQDQQDRLEERYTKLMARARENGAFEESSREAKKSKRVKKEYEEKKSALSAVTFTADASGKSLKRQEAELKAELDGLTSTYKAIIDQIRDKQRKLLEMAKDLKLLAPKLAGTGYESLLERIAASIADKEALVELPISAISVKYDRKPSQKSKNETSNRSLESESAPKPPQMIAKSTGFQKESPMPRPKPGDLSPKATNPPIKPVGISSKPSLFSSNVGSEGEVMEEVGGSFGGLGHGESSEPDIGKKPSFVASKPSLFGKSAKTEEKQTSFLLKTQNIPQTESTSSPSEPSFLPLSTNPEAPGPAFPPASDPTRSDLPSKPTLLPPPKPDPLKAIPVIPEQAEEIKTLDAFPSRRRGKHLGNEAISSLITSPSALSSLPPVVDSAIKPRNRDHLLVEDPQPTSMATVSPETVLEVPYKPTNLSIVGKPARDRSHLVDLASKPDEFPAISPVDSPREQKRLISGLETSVKPMDFALGGGNSDKHRGNEAKEKTKDLAKKAEKGGFFELDEESLDFTDLKPAGNVHQGLVASNQAEKPVKRTEIPKPDIVDLEESDILL